MKYLKLIIAIFMLSSVSANAYKIKIATTKGQEILSADLLCYVQSNEGLTSSLNGRESLELERVGDLNKYIYEVPNDALDNSNCSFQVLNINAKKGITTTSYIARVNHDVFKDFDKYNELHLRKTTGEIDTKKDNIFSRIVHTSHKLVNGVAYIIFCVASGGKCIVP